MKTLHGYETAPAGTEAASKRTERPEPERCPYPLLGQARRILALGFAPIPIAGEKRPPAGFEWARLQSELPTPAEVDDWFSRRGVAGIAAVAGEVLCLDFDEKHRKGIFADFCRKARECGLEELLVSLVRQRTPSGGTHLLWRSPAGHRVRNLKLARVASSKEASIETRGEGGYFLVAPSPGYVWENGSLDTLRELSADEQDEILALARSLDEIPPTPQHIPKEHRATSPGELTPGDDYNARADVPALLESHGWRRVGTGEYWTRPGKSSGYSGHWHEGERFFYCFTSSTVLEPSKGYSPFGLLAALEHNGDFAACAKRLRAEGFGSPRSATPAPRTLPGESPEEAREQADDGGKISAIPILDIKAPDESDRARTNLLGNGFLRRGQGGLFCGPTGIGKSVLLTQADLQWACGRACFGLRPEKSLRILIVQSENDDADVAEMRDGIIAGCAFAPEDMEKIRTNVRVLRSFKSGKDWLFSLTPHVEEHKPDLIIVDPLFAFAGVDLAKDQPGLSRFLRELVQPFILKHDCGILFAHHTNKPAGNTRDRAQWAAGDFAYVGSGHNELANWPRFVMSLRSLGSRTVFELRIGKRWKRAGIADDHGNPVDHVLVQHAEGKGIYWRPAVPEDLVRSVETASGGKGETRADNYGAKIVTVFHRKQEHGRIAIETLAKSVGTSVKTIRRTFGPANVLRVGDDILFLGNGAIYAAPEGGDDAAA